MDVDAVFGGNFRGILRFQADDVLNFLLHFLRPGGGQVDLVDDRQYFQPGVRGQEGIGQGLGLHALGSVHHQHRALAGGQGPGDFIAEVHMARGVDEVQVVGLPVVGGIGQLHRPGLDGDAPLPLQVHGVEDLVLHLPAVNGVAFLQQPVGQGGFAMVNVGDNGKIADFGKVCHTSTSLRHAGIPAKFLKKVNYPYYTEFFRKCKPYYLPISGAK